MQKTKIQRKINPQNISVSALGFSAVILLIFAPDSSLEYMKKSIELCLQSLVPTLFPFMIISDFLLSVNAFKYLRFILLKPISLIFGLSDNGSCAVAMGTLCGFPIGTKSSVKLYEENKISHREFLHIMSFCNIPSGAFVCGTVGFALQNVNLGKRIYLSLLLSSLIMGLFGRAVYKYERKNDDFSKSDTDTVTAFTSAVTSSASVMIGVCAYVVFFSVIIGYLYKLCTSLSLPRIITLLLCGLVEMSNGVALVSSEIFSNPCFAPAITAFFVGFSGISVTFQIFSLDKAHNLNKKIFVLQKFLQGLLCCAITYVSLKLFPVSSIPPVQTTVQIHFADYGLYVCLLFFICATLPLLATLIAQKRRK